MKLKIVHKGLLYLGIPLVVQGVFVAELMNLLSQTEKSIEREKFHIELSREMNATIIQFCRTLAVCGKGASKEFMPAAEYKKMMDAHLEKLADYTKNTSEEYQQMFNSSKQLFTAQYQLLNTLQTDTDDSSLGLVRRVAATKKFIAYAEKSSPVIYKAWQHEEELLDEERQRAQRWRAKIKQLVLWSSIVDLVMALVLFLVFVKTITRRLNLLMQNAAVLPESTQLPFKVEGDDEIASLDQSMHEAAAELIKAVNYRRSLLAMIAHDLKNPLTAVHMAFDLMLKGSEEGLVAVPDKRIKDLQSTTGQMTTLLDDLLSLDRMESSELRLDLTLVSASELIDETRSLTSSQVAEKRQNIETRIDASGVNVIADRRRLIQVLANFVGNAARFSPQNSTIEIAAAREGKSAVFSVTDTGPGIPEGLRLKVFDKYYQASDTVEGGKGYGLGLAICKQIVERHHGQIGVKSKAGAGATFWFSLPLDESLEAEVD
jgi:signal transduction histidine kinase